MAGDYPAMPTVVDRVCCAPWTVSNLHAVPHSSPPAPCSTAVVPPKPLLQALPGILDAKVAQVRDGAKQLTLELAQWVGRDAVRATIMGEGTWVDSVA